MNKPVEPMPTGCPECPLYRECKQTNAEDAQWLENYELSQIYKDVRMEYLTENSPQEREGDIDDQMWLLMHGPDKNDPAHEQEALDKLRGLSRDNLEFLSDKLKDYLTGHDYMDRSRAFIAQTRLEYRTAFTETVESKGCDGPTMKRKLFGKQVFVACNAPIDPVAKLLAEKPITLNQYLFGYKED